MPVRIFGLPPAACDPAKTWRAAAGIIADRLRAKYGESVLTEYIELFSPESFEHPDIMSLIHNGEAEPPFVTVNGKLIQSGGKLSEGRIRKELERLGLESTAQER